MTSRKQWLIAKVTSEGYCCLNGYLRLCKLRGETAEGMAKNIGMSPDTIWYHYRKMPACQKQAECMEPVLEIISQTNEER